MIEVKNLSKTFRLKSGNVDALNDVSLSIDDGTVYGVIGYSGAGKSTLVRCLNLLEVPDQGSITIGNYRDIQIKTGLRRKGDECKTAEPDAAGNRYDFPAFQSAGAFHCF